MSTGPIIGDRNIVQTFPPVCKDVISHFLDFAPAKYAYLTRNQSKGVGTLHSQQQHFVRFLKQLEVEVTLMSVKPYSQTLIAIVYLSALSKGFNCKNISIRKSTLRGYMHCVALYSQANCGRNILLNPDTNLPTSLWKDHQMIKLISNYQSRMKGPTNKKDPLTKRMISHMQDRARFLVGTPDCFQQALTPWLVLTLMTGYCGIEWLQEHNIDDEHDFTYYEHAVDFTSNLIYAKCRKDWLFYNCNGKIFPKPLEVDPNTIDSNSDRFCFQKNSKMNNQVVYYKSLHDHPKWCLTRAKLDILARTERLKVPDNLPLAVYKRNWASKRPSYMTRKRVTVRLNEAGRAVYYDHNVPFTKKGTPHSCCIGATALLFARFCNPEIVKTQLCWASEKWREYIRFTPISARVHSKAVTEVNTDNFDFNIA